MKSLYYQSLRDLQSTNIVLRRIHERMIRQITLLFAMFVNVPKKFKLIAVTSESETHKYTLFSKD